MSEQPPITFKTEPTPLGAQTLIPGVRPVSNFERLMVLTAQLVAVILARGLAAADPACADLNALG
jgi:hypothetical protein